MQLHYLRDREKREVDLLTVKQGKPEFLVEAKLSDSALSPHLTYFKERVQPVQAFQLVKDLPREKMLSGIEIRRASAWLNLLET
jgi:hypothetical protein